MVDESDGGNGGRVTAAERLEHTRARLLDAVIESLAAVGFAATSTTEVARRSGLTRGAQLHHFGTKDQMMLAAVGHLHTRGETAEVLAALDRIDDEDERMRAALAVLSVFPFGPFTTAYIELWIASRAHPELLEALREADVVSRENVRALFGEKILAKAGPEFDSLLDITMYALRGMAIDAHLATRDERRVRREMIAGLEKYLRESLEEPPNER